MKKVIAIFASDLHLQARAPVARCGEPDWFEAMARPLRELNALTEEHECPILYAGDIFDQWYAGPEVINFALANLPRGIAIPGQHDLPNHSYEEIHRSAYWTLVKAGKLTNLKPGTPAILRGGGVVWGFPWGHTIAHPGHGPEGLQIALIHKYVWGKDTGYPGAPKDNLIKAYKGCLQGFDVAVFGDNHKGFIREAPGGPTICNCGGMMRRKTDERNYRPGCGLLHADGTVTRHYYNPTEEHFIELTEAEEAVEKVLDMGAFVESLRGLGAGDALDFHEALKRFLDENEPEQRVREIILTAAGGK